MAKKSKKNNNVFLEFLGTVTNLGVCVVAIIAIFLPVFSYTILTVTVSVGLFDDYVLISYIIPYLLIALAGIAGAGLLFKKKSNFITSIALSIVCVVAIVLIYTLDQVDLGAIGTVSFSEQLGIGPIVLTISGVVGAAVNGFFTFLKFK